MLCYWEVKIQILIRISTRRKLYRDIYSQLHREFGVNSYKAIKRYHLDRAIQMINEEYSIPTVLNEEITVKTHK